MDSIRRIKVFISSPGDMGSERELIEQICNDINNDIGDLKKFRIEPITWEKNTVSGVGPRSQEVINAQAPDYDLYIGLMGFYFGSDTGSFSSGTEEEFELAFERYTKSGYPKIQFYFSEAKVSPQRVDFSQFEKVTNFKKNIGGRGVYYRSFEDLTQLQVLVRKGVHKYALELLNEHNKNDGETGNRSLSYAELKPYDKLKNLNEKFSSDPSISSHFLMIEAAKHLDDFTERLRCTTAKLVKTTKILNSFAKEMNAVSGRGKRSQTRAVKGLERLLSNMEDLVFWLSYEISRMDEDFMNGMSTFQRACLILKTSKSEEDNSIADALESMENLKPQLSELCEAIRFSSGEMEKTIGIGPRWDGSMKVFIAIGADLIDFFDRAIATIDETRTSIQQA